MDAMLPASHVIHASHIPFGINIKIREDCKVRWFIYTNDFPGIFNIDFRQEVMIMTVR
jgi:hypothetical protein